MAVAAASYPVQLDLQAPAGVARWRPLVHWLLALPHFILLYVLNAVSGVLTFLAWFAILFTGRYPRAMFDFMATIYRYSWRTMTYLTWMREKYPPFDLNASATDPGTDPASFSVEYPDHLSRGLIFIKWLLAIPHYLVILVLALVAYVAIGVSFFAVLITGRWPEGLRRFVIGVMRWGFRVQAYTNLMTDQYPPFSLAP